MYKITDYTYRRAAILGVDVTPSRNKNKKINVYKNSKKLASIGFLELWTTRLILKKKDYNLPIFVGNCIKIATIRIGI